MASVHGHVGRIIHQEDGFYILSLEVEHCDPYTPEHHVTVTGHPYGISQLTTGVAIQFVGDWVRHPKYGRQFSLYGWFPWATHDYGVERFLRECVPKFEDAKLVEHLVESFGTTLYDQMTDHPDTVLATVGDDNVRKMTLETALISWGEGRALSNLSIFLQDYDISEKVVRNVFTRFGTEAVRLISDNPYRLVSVDGFEFAKADRLAERIGISKTDDRRFDGAVFWVLKQESQEGHLSVRRGDFGDILKSALNTDRMDGFSGMGVQDRLMASVDRLENMGAVRVDPTVGVYLPELYLYEREGAKKLSEFLTPSKLEDDHDIELFLTDYEKGNLITFSEAQKTAVRNLMDHHVLVLTGLPGTGKTTLIRAIVRLFKKKGLTFALMAPTGIAAKRLSAVTGESASTIHRSLGWTGEAWSFNSRNKFGVGAVIVDEISMVDQELFYRILDALHPSTMLVFVGDDAQLPSVGPGNVLRELLSCESVPHVRLTQIFRQSEQSAIVVASHKIHKGESPQLDDRRPEEEFQFLRMLDEERILDSIVQMSVRLKSRDANFQVLSPKYDGTVGVHELNQAIREKLNPSRGQKEIKVGKMSFREGDRLMVVKNDYNLSVSNGDMGKLMSIGQRSLEVRIHGVGVGSPEMLIEIPKDRVLSMLRLAYAITVHKSQGSEFDTVILPIVKSQGRMLQRNLFYTAVTRARKKVWLLGDPSAVYKAIGNDRVVQRNTAFSRSVQEAALSGVERSDVQNQTPIRTAPVGTDLIQNN